MAQVKLEWDAHRQGETVVSYDIYRRVLSASQAAPRRRRFWSHMVFGGWRKVDEVPGDHQVYTDDGRMLFRKWLRPTYKHNTEINPLYNYEYRIVAVDKRGNRSPPSHCRVYSTGPAQGAGVQVDGVPSKQETKKPEEETKEPSFSYGTVDVSTPRGVYDKDHKHIALGWELEGNPNDLLRYDVERRQINEEGMEADWDNKPAVAQPPHKDEDIEPNKIYKYRVRAVDKSGVEGDWKETEPIPTTVETSEEEPAADESDREAPQERKPERLSFIPDSTWKEVNRLWSDSVETFIKNLLLSKEYDKHLSKLYEAYEKLCEIHDKYSNANLSSEAPTESNQLVTLQRQAKQCLGQLPKHTLTGYAPGIKQQLKEEYDVWLTTDDDIRNLNQTKFKQFAKKYNDIDNWINNMLRNNLKNIIAHLQDYNNVLKRLKGPMGFR